MMFWLCNKNEVPNLFTSLDKCLLILSNSPSRFAEALYMFTPCDLLKPHKRHLSGGKPFRIIPK
jgi:hypothetical protein